MLPSSQVIVTAGPYSVVRNPLYVFSAIGTAGIGAQTGSAFLALLFAAGALAVFQVVARREETFLAATFPADFAAYAARVPRFWPRLSQWREADELRVKPRLVRRTLGRIVRREELWNGNRESFRLSFLSRDSVIYFALRNNWRRRREYVTRLAPYNVVRLRTQYEVDRFLEQAS